MTIIDFSGQRCPIPLVQTKLALKQLEHGQSIEIVLSDSGSRRDVPAFLKKSGYHVTQIDAQPQYLRLQITCDK
ncbi:sulfurtransferase TusA family protein [Shewanella marina]|uniref:sulfurtransferase TusA family protein n=1 Tax=Shewanella marina TaxID=487319 RepID=UPI000470BEFE|nr:sulfurtransferase TusA family protein [Shewanella marina]